MFHSAQIARVWNGSLRTWDPGFDTIMCCLVTNIFWSDYRITFWISARHGYEVLPQDTRYLIQRPCYQEGGSCQDPAGNRTTQRPPEYRKEMQTAMVWSCFPIHQVWPKPSCKAQWKGEEDKAERGKVGRQHQGMDRPGVRQVPESSGEWGKVEETGCEIICGAPTTLAVKG